MRHPASNCNLVGLRPTFGRVSRFGEWNASWSDGIAGPITKTVDNAIVYSVIAVYDPADPLSLNESPQDYRAGLGDSIAGVRIGVPVDDWVWKDWLSEEEEEVARAAVAKLEELGAHLAEVRMPLSEHARNKGLGWSLASERSVFIRDTLTQEQIDEWP